MNPIFNPHLNRFLRHAMRPFADVIPMDYLPRVTGKIVVTIDESHSFELLCNPTSFQAKCLFFQGIKGWEPNAMRIFRELIPDVRGFLDIGANIGVYSLVAASLNPSAQIISFEPSPDAFHFLKMNISLNNFMNVRPCQTALSDECGKARFHLSIDPTFKDLDYHLTPTGGFDRGHSSHTPVVRSFDVSTRRLDQYLLEQEPNFKTDLMKLDTESSEHLVLAGATGVLTDHRPVIMCEVLSDTIEKELITIFREYDYLAYRAGRDGLTLTTDLQGHDYSEKEHFMIPKEKLPAYSRFIH